MKVQNKKKIKHPEDELILIITGKTVREVLSTYDMKELMRLSAILTFMKSLN